MVVSSDFYAFEHPDEDSGADTADFRASLRRL